MQREGFSFPVGRVEFLYLYPATFDEYLGALGECGVQEAIHQAAMDKTLPTAIHEQAARYFRTFMIVGGMPELIES